MGGENRAEKALILLRSRLCNPNFIFSAFSDSPDSNYSKLKFILSDSVTESCNNSILLLGPRGCGKIAVLELVLRDLQAEHPETISVVRLNGILHSDDNFALKEIARQLCLEHQLLFSKVASSDDNSQFMIAMLRECGLAHRTVIFVLDEFDLFTQGKQRLLYCLLDALQSVMSQAVVIGVSCRLDADQLLEKRVRSRFSHRKLLFLPPSKEDLQILLKRILSLPADSSFPHDYVVEFNEKIHNILADKRFTGILNTLSDADSSVNNLLSFLFRAICYMDMESGFLSLENFKTASLSIQRQPKLDSLQADCSLLELYILVCMKRLEVKKQNSYNFNSVMKEYKEIHDSYQTSDYCARNVCLRAFEHLLQRELISFVDVRGQNQSIEFRSVKLLVSYHEFDQGLKLNRSTLLLFIRNQGFLDFTDMERAHSPEISILNRKRGRLDSSFSMLLGWLDSFNDVAPREYNWYCCTTTTRGTQPKVPIWNRPVDTPNHSVLTPVICLIIGLTSFTVFKPSFSHLPISNLRLFKDAGLRMLMIEDSSSPTQRLNGEMKPTIEVADSKMKQEIKIPDNETKQEIRSSDNETKQEIKLVVDINEITTKQESFSDSINETKPKTNVAVIGMKQEVKIQDNNETQKETKVADIKMKNETKVGDMEMKQEIKAANSKMKQEMKLRAVCDVSDPRSDVCDIDGDIRIHGKSSTILFASSQNGILGRNESWRIKPYARKVDKAAMASVNELSVKSFDKNDEKTPHCTQNHTVPAIIFSVAGYSLNHFHDYADILVPLFLTSHQFHQEVQFLVTNARANYWISKYETILKHLSRYPIIDIDNENDVHCYRRVMVGLKFHKDLGIDPLKSPKGYSMKDFSQFLRNSYSLKTRSSAIKIRRGRKSKKPRLLIVSRKRSRKFTNEAEIANMAKSLGYEVIVEDPGISMNLSRFAQVVSSCDVMMGVHGAGLTNIVFLPTNAVLIQIIPLGGLEWFSRHDFGEPAKGMNLRYLEYKIREEESSLIEEYPLDHAVFRDPLSFAKQGWNALKSVYLDKQNVKLDVGRFRPTLLKALELLHR
ncbi:Glycosyltransferase AER61 [Macleaya cordata]|uniref:Origin of replication complex subunit 4 n=1 Tax=Macleaya cordata TaxID=56857 RepID=A0A200QUT3_MACCD|nr:Glycosyltransferase AER61 [Macleaya cordata]